MRRRNRRRHLSGSTGCDQGGEGIQPPTATSRSLRMLGA